MRRKEEGQQQLEGCIQVGGSGSRTLTIKTVGTVDGNGPKDKNLAGAIAEEQLACP